MGPLDKTYSFLAYSLLIDPIRVWRDGIEPFADGGDPAGGLLRSAKAQGETLSEFPFVKDRYVVHRGRGSLSAVWESGETTHPSYEWPATTTSRTSVSSRAQRPCTMS